MVTATCTILNHTPIYSISHFASIVVYHDLCLTEHVKDTISPEDSEYASTWWPMWVATTIPNRRTIVHNMLLANTFNLGNTPISIIRRKGTVALLLSSHFQVLCSCITSLHSTWHTVRNLPAAQAQDFQVMGHCGKDITCTNVVMVGLKCSPQQSSQNECLDLQVHRECLQDHREIIQSIGQHLPARLLHLNLLQVPLGNTPSASHWGGSSHQWNRRQQISQGLRTRPQCRRCPRTNMMQLMRATIRRTWAVHKANPQSAWSKLNSHWSNLPKGWASPTIVHSTSGRKYEWWGYSGRNIGPLSGGRTISNRFEMVPFTRRRWLQIFWRHSRTGCHWSISIMWNGFASSGLRCF